jgi:hypothetical protein
MAARWLGAPPGWAAELVHRFADRIEQVDFDGIAAWVALGDTKIQEQGYGELRLLPYFDAYLIGCFPRATLFPGRAAERALSGGQAGNVPALLVDGVVAGIWRQRRSGRRMVVTLEPFVRRAVRPIPVRPWAPQRQRDLEGSCLPPSWRSLPRGGGIFDCSSG